MARDENPPFGLGATAEAAGATDMDHWVGKEWIFEDRDPTSLAIRTNLYKRCRLVRNVSAGVLEPKRLVTLKKTAGKNASEVDGYADVTAEQSFPVDEFIPTAGVAVNDIFWIVIEGPALIKTGLANGAGELVIGVHSWVVAATAATSGATTSGRIEVASFAGATAVLADQIMNRLGQAMTARTTANTNTDTLINMGQW